MFISSSFNSSLFREIARNSTTHYYTKGLCNQHIVSDRPTGAGDAKQRSVTGVASAATVEADHGSRAVGPARAGRRRCPDLAFPGRASTREATSDFSCRPRQASVWIQTAAASLGHRASARQRLAAVSLQLHDRKCTPVAVIHFATRWYDSGHIDVFTIPSPMTNFRKESRFVTTVTSYGCGARQNTDRGKEEEDGEQTWPRGQRNKLPGDEGRDDNAHEANQRPDQPGLAGQSQRNKAQGRCG